MKILITNDDGINAPGLKALLQPLKNAGHKLILAAPAFESSASSHSITVHEPIFVDEYYIEHLDIKGWSITGKPADCVKLALEVLLEEKPDMVVSGINKGPNLGIDTVYSGTVSAALEASMHNIPAIAFSLNTRLKNADYSIASEFVVSIIDEYKNYPIKSTTMLNINIPYVAKKEDIKGNIVTKLGDVAYSNVFAPRRDLQGRQYYWLGGEMINNNSCDIDFDINAINNNYIAITPLSYDLTDYNALNSMQNKNK